MESSTLLQTDYLDIIFGQRNKKYGGYELRKHYNQRLGKAAMALLAGVGAFAGLSFITLHKAEALHGHTTVVAPTFIPIDPPKQMPKVPMPPPAPPHHIRTNAFTEPVITDEPIKPAQQMPENPITNIQPGTANTPGDSTGIAEAPVSGHGKEIITQPETLNKPLVWVEQMPQFMGDRDAYMSSHLQYPAAAQASGIHGRVVIQFIVNEDGSVSNATVIQGIGGGCDEEALRVVKAMPKWKPGKQNGRAVKVFFTVPINFVLAD